MTVVEEIVFTNEAPAGTVVEQDVAEGTLVNKGETLNVKIAQPMDAPGLVGMTSEDAADAAAAARTDPTPSHAASRGHLQ